MPPLPDPVDPTSPSGSGFIVFHLRKSIGFFLRIPVDDITTKCLKPIKYLYYLGYYIIGSDGKISGSNIRVDTDIDKVTKINDQDIFEYHLKDETKWDISRVIDIRMFANPTSTTDTRTERREKFAEFLYERDKGFCIFTGLKGGVQGIHMIPHWVTDEVMFRVSNRNIFYLLYSSISRILYLFARDMMISQLVSTVFATDSPAAALCISSGMIESAR